MVDKCDVVVRVDFELSGQHEVIGSGWWDKGCMIFEEVLRPWKGSCGGGVGWAGLSWWCRRCG